jgi:hypothetical protein
MILRLTVVPVFEFFVAQHLIGKVLKNTHDTLPSEMSDAVFRVMEKTSLFNLALVSVKP